MNQSQQKKNQDHIENQKQSQTANAQNEKSSCVYLKEFDVSRNQHFCKKIFLPYFKDIYNDLLERSENKDRGISKFTFIRYCKLPGLIGERFFKVSDQDNDGYISKKEFIQTMFKVYYASLETRLSLIFDMYDFDDDGKISSSDIFLLLSHSPNSEDNNEIAYFNQEENSSELLKSREFQIQGLFQKSKKTSMDIKEFIAFNQEIGSEFFLSLIIVIHQQLPCSSNFIKYLRNYDSFLSDNSQVITASDPSQSSLSLVNNLIQAEYKDEKSAVQHEIRSFQQPSTNLGLNSLSQFLSKYENNVKERDELSIQANKRSPNSSLLKSPSPLKGQSQMLSTQNLEREEQKSLLNISQNSQKNKFGLLVPISMKNGKLSAKSFQMQPGSYSFQQQQSGLDQRSAMLSNQNNKTVVEQIQIQNVSLGFVPYGGGFMTYAYQGTLAQQQQQLVEKELKVNQNMNHIYDHFKLDEDTIEYQVLEGNLYRKLGADNLKIFWFSLLGNQLYCFNKKEEEIHKDMHCLDGAFVKLQKEEWFDNDTKLFPFKIIFPSNKINQSLTRIYYSTVEEERNWWYKSIKRVIGQLDIEDYYEFTDKILSKGKNYQIVIGISKESNEQRAIKVIKKKNLNQEELSKFLREIDILNICNNSNPNILKQFEVLEDEKYIYQVFEYCKGGTLWNYINNHGPIKQQHAFKIVKQLINALAFLHKLGIVHNNLKFENILIENDNAKENNMRIQVCDFKNSVLLGPKEESKEYFGQLAYLAPEIVKQGTFNQGVDVWALGVIMYYLITNNFPFNSSNNQETISQISSVDQIQLKEKEWKQVTNEIQQLTLQLLNKDQKQRIKIEGVLQRIKQEENII